MVFIASKPMPALWRASIVLLSSRLPCLVELEIAMTSEVVAEFNGINPAYASRFVDQPGKVAIVAREAEATRLASTL